MLKSVYEKSSYSNGGADTCLEARVNGTVDVRDNQNPQQDPLNVDATAWREFLADIDRF